MSQEPQRPPPSAPAPERLLSLATGGYVVANCIFAAAQLDLASALTGGPRSAQEIASQLGLDAGAVRRLLRALSSAAVFEQLPDGRFALTELSRLLVDGTPGSLRALLRGGAARWHHALWGELAELVRTGAPIAPRVLGSPLYDYLEAHPEEGAAFNAQKVGFSGRLTSAVLEAYDLSWAGVLVDVGAGLGHFLAAALARYPAARGVLFDLPGATAQAAASLESSAVRARIELCPGDFFRGVPEHGDAYVLMNILHNWDDARAEEILRACRRAMGQGSRLVVVEMVLPEIASAPHFGLLLDVEMMVLFHGGRERSEAELRGLFERAGLRLARVVPTASRSSVLEVVPS